MLISVNWTMQRQRRELARMASRFDLGWLRLAAIKIQVALLPQTCMPLGAFLLLYPLHA